MIFGWWKARRRRRILETPFPAGWEPILCRNVGHYGRLTTREQLKLKDDVRIFVAEKVWEGCGGLEMTDEIRVTVAAQACLVVLALDHDFYSGVASILVYPQGFCVRRQETDGYLVTEGTEDLVGEAHSTGCVVLAWNEVLESGRHPGEGENLVYHEFAHQLDMADGVIDGTPILEDSEAYDRWREVMTVEYERLRKDVRAGKTTVLDRYGATDPGEFFAVATEAFFDRPEALERTRRGLYDLLRDFYRQDPARQVGDRSDH